MVNLTPATGNLPNPVGTQPLPPTAVGPIPLVLAPGTLNPSPAPHSDQFSPMLNATATPEPLVVDFVDNAAGPVWHDDDKTGLPMPQERNYVDQLIQGDPKHLEQITQSLIA